MKLRDIFSQNTPRNILIRGLFGLLAGLLCATIFTVYTGQNAFIRFALPIFGVPIILTVLNLLLCHTKRE